MSIEPKCVFCGKPRGDHKARTAHCPLGRKNRTHGYQGFSSSMIWMEPTPRGGPRPGAGRKTKSPDGEAMKTRHIRMNEQQWADTQLVGADALRAWVTKQARKLRKEGTK